VHDLRGALTSDYVQAEERIWSYAHPTRPELRMVPPAFRLPGEEMPRRAAAACGADTDDVLREIGYSDARIAGLREKGVL
jgi:crotonobetainyl-CoA:carnitine CoA-transferase CaiB-like acyl-CoA transferase